MKRTIACLALMSVTGFALAQSAFTIVRPFDGSKVREKVRILMPKNSIPPAGYVGVFLNNKFIEAVEPKLDAKGDYYEYILDTKGRGIADGSMKLELKLYVDYSTQPRIVDTTSVDVTVSNKASIVVPDEGISLRYRFGIGAERIYDVISKTIVNSINEADNKEGAKAAQIETDGIRMTLLYAVDNAYSNGDGLVRIQIVPDKGINKKEYSFLQVSGATAPKRYYSRDMSPIYMRVTPTGREVFGSVPDFYGIEGNSGPGARQLLLAPFPLPVLPSKKIKVGDSWQTQWLVGDVDLANLPNTKNVTKPGLARGEFVGVEWEMGHPCAKIKNSIELGMGASASGVNGKLSDLKISGEETIWFALDTRQIVKIFRDETKEIKVPVSGGFSGPGGPSGPPGSGSGRPGAGGRPGRGAKDADDFSIRPGDYSNGSDPLSLNLQRRPGGSRSGGGPSAGGPPQGGPGGFGPPGGGPGGFGAPAAPQFVYVRERNQRTFILIK